jgi:RecB family endonuclease NucS
MYKINKQSNSIKQLEKKSFSSLGFREREHLQEWIAKEPNVLGEHLLIIQKEFSGFDDTHERLDLLALDKQGAFCPINNKYGG